MNCFLEQPQLPSAAVSTVVIGARYFNEFAAKLDAFGVETWSISGPACLDERLRDHADLLLLHCGKERFIAAEDTILHNYICIYNYVNLIANDAALNICTFGPYWLGSPVYAAWRPDDMIRISVRQRYARCSSCIVDEQSIITSDRGIAKAAKEYGVDVLLISPGHILLDGFNYGFIGGASFKLAPDKLAFTGSLRHHPDEERINAFLEKRRIVPVCLSSGPLRDIGSAVLIHEKIQPPLP